MITSAELQAAGRFTVPGAQPGAPNAAPNRALEIPGMNHCQGGDGPDTFDRMKVIDQWVEHGQTPGRIIASHATGGVVDRTRPLCAYPEVARYTGTGSTDEAANFVCRMP